MSDHHHHHHDSSSELSFDDKFDKLLEHWLKHNEDHASNYRNWAEKAKANGHAGAAKHLEEAADLSLAINAKFQKARALLSDK